MAVRPSDVDFVDEGGLRCIVRRRASLGEIVDYQVAVGSQTLRIQKTRHEAGPQVGETCGLRFAMSTWYPLSDPGEGGTGLP